MGGTFPACLRGSGALPTDTKQSHGHFNFHILQMLGYLAHDIHAFELIEVDDKMNSCPPHYHPNALSEVENLHAQEGKFAVRGFIR